MNSAKLRLTSFQKPQFQSVSIIFKFVHLRFLSVIFAALFLPSSHVLSSYFLCFTQFGGGHHCFSLDKFHDTAPLQKNRVKEKRKKEREKKREREREREREKERKTQRKEKQKPCLTCFFSSFSSMIDGSSCFSGSATGTSAVSDFSLLRLFLFSFFLSFSCFSFLSDLSLRCLRLDSLDSVF